MIENKIQRNIPLAPFTTFHIGGPADQFVVVQTRSELIEAVQYAKRNNIHFFVLGLGANILVADNGYRGLVIKNETKRHELLDAVTNKQPFRQLIAESGCTIEELINYTSELGLSGLEHFAGIPSTLGGALWQNLHFLSPDRSKTVFIGDIVFNANVLDVSKINDSDSQLEVWLNKTFNFGYDYSTLHKTHDIVVSVVLTLQNEKPEVIKERIAANLAWRKEKHPENAAKSSAGSVFKKIERHGAGRLIEQVGLKGKQIGGAEISEKHANFIINTGNASAKDVRELIQLVQNKVKEKLGLDLKTEISFVGEF